MNSKDEQFELYKKEQLKKLAERIKELRIQKGYTSYEYFAYDHNIPRAQYGRYEKGEDLKFSSLLKVLQGLDISLKEFFEEGF
jgi:transcriptional regulator with XRE-family HTH domain